MRKSKLDQEIAWFKPKPRYNMQILDHLLMREWAYVPITSRILSSEPLFKSQYFSIFATGNTGAFNDVIMITRDGLILPAFNVINSIHYENRNKYKVNGKYKRNLLDLIKTPTYFHSTMGLTNDVSNLEDMLLLNPTVKLNHHLMTITATELEMPEKESDYQIRKATVDDTEIILPLREAYELEEVVLNPNTFSKQDCRNRLKITLERELAYIAVFNGKPLSITTTSSRGLNTDQIGGVFTEKNSRNKSLATAVLKSLLNDIFKTKNNACLFVKSTNTPAINLYRSLGFTFRSDYSISYYTQTYQY